MGTGPTRGYKVNLVSPCLKETGIETGTGFTLTPSRCLLERCSAIVLAFSNNNFKRIQDCTSEPTTSGSGLKGSIKNAYQSENLIAIMFFCRTNGFLIHNVGKFKLNREN